MTRRIVDAQRSQGSRLELVWLECGHTLVRDIPTYKDSHVDCKKCDKLGLAAHLR